MDMGSEPSAITPMVTTVKRKRGRPSKSDMLAQAQAGTNGVLPKARRARKKSGDGVRPMTTTTTMVADDLIIGQPVHGTLDGCFDAGYILTVRVGSTDTVLRGVVFGPGLSLPITKETDIAPNVKLAKREENVVLPIAYHTPMPVSVPAHTVPRLSSAQPAAPPLPVLSVADAKLPPDDVPNLAQYHVTPSPVSNEYTNVMQPSSLPPMQSPTACQTEHS
ncbi:hypothetical protein O6H91_10G066800 [Diphasiastrum complanatum]|nr:hypothetical protein O6H91_10G066800 [Diphasiastrum complanatum]